MTSLRSTAARRLAALLVLASVTLTTPPPTRAGEPADANLWRASLRGAAEAFAAGDGRAAHLAWEKGYRAAMRDRGWQGLVSAADTYIRIGGIPGQEAAAPRARRLYLAALFRAWAARSGAGLVAVAEAFAALGDTEVATRSATLAERVAEQERDTASRDRAIALRRRLAAGGERVATATSAV